MAAIISNQLVGNPDQLVLQKINLNAEKRYLEVIFHENLRFLG